MHNFQKLKVWQEALEISVSIFELTRDFPKDELYGLTSQMRRSAVSVVSNIAEGAGRNSNGEFNQFLGMAVGSSFELETQLIISERLNYCSSDICEQLRKRLQQNQKMTYKLKSSLS